MTVLYQIFGYFFHGKIDRLNGSGHILGEFFTNSSGHHGDKIVPIFAARVARIILLQTQQLGENIPNYHKVYRTAINDTKWP
jgi:hypothetical protein